MKWLVPVGPRLWFRLAMVAALLVSTMAIARIPAEPALAEPVQIEQASPPEIPLESQLPAVLEGPLLEPSLDEADYHSTTSESPARMDDGSADEALAGEAGPEGDVVDSVRSSISSRGGTRSPSAVQPQLSQGDVVASVARQYEGFRYSWGGVSPRTGFDCSGFMWYVYQEAGIPLPSRNLWGMLGAGQRISQDELRPGDLVFFDNTYTYGLSHGGIYLGDNQFIHAVTEGVGVKIDPLRGSGWGAHYSGASRPW